MADFQDSAFRTLVCKVSDTVMPELLPWMNSATDGTGSTDTVPAVLPFGQSCPYISLCLSVIIICHSCVLFCGVSIRIRWLRHGRWWALPTAGVLSSGKLEMLFSLTTNFLSVYKSNGIAVLVHPNRSAQLEPAAKNLSLLLLALNSHVDNCGFSVCVSCMTLQSRNDFLLSGKTRM